MLMALTRASHAYFVVWTTTDLHIEGIAFSDDHWKRLHSCATLFFRSYVLPVLLEKRELGICPKCNCLVLEEDEIDQLGMQSVCCEDCNTWWHWECAGITSSEEVEGIFNCPSCVLDMATMSYQDCELADECV